MYCFEETEVLLLNKLYSHNFVSCEGFKHYSVSDIRLFKLIHFFK